MKASPSNRSVYNTAGCPSLSQYDVKVLLIVSVKMDVLKDLEAKTEQELHNITVLTYQVIQTSLHFTLPNFKAC